MGIKFRDLVKETRDVVVVYDGEEVNVVYRPGAITPKMQMVAARMQDMGADEDGKKAKTAAQAGAEMADVIREFVEVIELLVAKWDITDDDGVMLPVTVATIREMPMGFLSAVFGASVGDMRPNA